MKAIKAQITASSRQLAWDGQLVASGETITVSAETYERGGKTLHKLFDRLGGILAYAVAPIPGTEHEIATYEEYRLSHEPLAKFLETVKGLPRDWQLGNAEEELLDELEFGKTIVL